MAKVDIPEEGLCLMCSATHKIQPGTRALAVHPSPDQSDSPCPGSSRVFAQGDGKDDVRRSAIRGLAVAEGSLAALRAEMLSSLAPDRRLGGWLEHYGDMVVSAEMCADLWGQTMMHGDMWETFAKVQGLRIRCDGPWDQARARGALAWLRQARTELFRAAAHMGGPAGDVLHTLVFTIG